jgi:CRISPR-associated protein Csx10
VEIRVQILTPICLASSVGSVAGDVDIETDNIDGLPLLRGKTLKGLLAEETANILRVLEPESGPWSDAADRILGISGDNRPAVLQFQDGWIQGLPSVSKENRRSTFEAITTIRRQTAIDGQTGIAKNHSLRSARLLRSGLTFVNRVNILEELGPKECALLSAAVAALRRAGLNRNRGWGEICARLFFEENDVTEEWLGELENPSQSHLRCLPNFTSKTEVIKSSLGRKLTFSLLLNSPVVMAKSGHDPSTVETHRHIPGSAILGSAASTWLRLHPQETDPAINPEFRKLFLDGQVRWCPAYPAYFDRTSIPCPRSFVAHKGDTETIYDLILENQSSDCKPCSGYVSFSPEYTDLGKVDVATQIRLHHQRDPDLGRSDGDLFSYESLSADQRFFFDVHVEDTSLSVQVVKLVTESALQLGRSRSAGYGGAALVQLVESSIQNAVDNNDCLVVTLLSDYIGIDDYGCPRPEAIVDELQTKLGVEKPVRAFLKSKRVGGYVNVWRMPRPTQIGLEAGSVLVFNRPENLCQSKIDEAVECGLGERKAEGYGCFAVDLHGEENEFKVKATKPFRRGLNVDTPTSPVVEAMIQDWQDRKTLLEQAHKVKFSACPSRSLIARIRSRIKSSQNKEDLKEFLSTLERVIHRKGDRDDSFVRAGKSADKALLRARVNYQSMKSWLEVWTGLVDHWPCPETFKRVKVERQWPLARYYLDIVLDRMRRETAK